MIPARAKKRRIRRQPRDQGAEGAFDQSLRYLLQQEPEDFITFAQGDQPVQVLRPGGRAPRPGP